MIDRNIEGMSCAYCVMTVAEALAVVKGVEEMPEVMLNPGGALVRGDASPETLITAVKQAGYQVSLAA